MNIILVSQEYPPETGWGGIGTYTYHLAHGLAARGHRVRVLSYTPEPVALGYAEGSVRVYRVPNRHPLTVLRRARLGDIAAILGWSWSLAESLGGLLRNEPADLVEAPLWGAEALVSSLFHRVPLVVRAETTRSISARINGFDRRWWALNLRAGIAFERLLARRATLVLAISHSIASVVRADCGLLPEQVRVSYLGLPSPMPGTSPPPDGLPPFLFVGRLEERKGIRFLLQAIPQVVAELPAARFLIAGRDSHLPGTTTSYEQFFRSFASPQALAATSFLGFVPQQTLDQLYRQAAAVVAPSLYESFGLVHLEAMTYSKPVVAFAAGATPELVSHEVSGLLVAPSDVAGLAAALVRLGRDAALRQRLGVAAAYEAGRRFSLTAMVESTLLCYDEALRRWNAQSK